MLIFNWIGLGLMLLWAGVLAVTMEVTQERAYVLAGIIVGCILAAAADVLLRLGVLNDKVSRLQLIHPNSGGHIFFIPVWLCTILVAAFAVLLFIRGGA